MRVNAFFSLSLLILILQACGGGGGSPIVSGPYVDVSPEGYTQFNNNLSAQLDALPLGSLSAEEEAGLIQMREEEKLARDVYDALYQAHALPIFSNISDSEQTHTDAVLALLERYSVADPVGTNAAGIFTDSGLQSLYDYLVALGSHSLLDGLYVGAMIEDLDIYDLDQLKLDIVDNKDIQLVYDNLQKGSRNHLRAFYDQIIANNGSYSPTYISQEAFDEIINSEMERGN